MVQHCFPQRTFEIICEVTVFMKKIGKDILIALISALATGLVAYVATNASVGNSIVAAMSE